MNTSKRVSIFYHELTEDTPFCVNCGRYYPHYVRNTMTGNIEPITAGHCVYPRTKCRNAYDTCEYFEKKKKE